MACKVSLCNEKIIKSMNELIAEEDFKDRNKLYRHLALYGGDLYYLAAPLDIPRDVYDVEIPTGEILPVLHLEQRICDDGTMTRKADWEGVHEGKYVTDRGFFIVEVRKDITKEMASRPMQRLIREGIIKVSTMGRMEAEWAYMDNEVVTKREYNVTVPSEERMIADMTQKYERKLEALQAEIEHLRKLIKEM